jgi:energy-coupling factor transporter transmembrane protein EcfT
MSATALATGVGAPEAHASRAPSWAVPILLGSLVGSLGAGRIVSASACLAAAMVCAIASGARAPKGAWWRTLAIGAAIAWFLNAYLTEGRAWSALPAIAGRSPTVEGAAYGSLLVMRLVGAFTALAGLAAAWPAERAVDTVSSWLAPLRRLGLPVHEARAVTGLALRFVPLMNAEARRIARVQEVRAGRPARGAREWITRRRAGAVPTLVGALERAERVALALDARHYRLRPAGAVRWPRDLGGWGAWTAGAGLAVGSIAWRG